MPVEWLSTEKCRKMMGHHVYGRLATSDGKGVPYITPVNYVYMNDCIYIHCAFKGRKIDNIKANPRVCFEISSPGNLYVSERACGFSMRYWSIIVEGNARSIGDRELKKEVLAALMEKYAGNFDYTDPAPEEIDRVNVIEISAESITGKMGIDPQPGEND